MPDSSQKLPPLARSWDDVGKKLFVPEHYEFSDMEQLCAFISDYPVGQMVTHQNQETKISAVPFVIENNTFGGRPLLLGHMAERNEQASAVRAESEATLLFAGPGAYISPRWFAHHMTAPTWSYVSVQARGRLVAINDDSETINVLKRTISHMEGLTLTDETETAWTIDELTDEQTSRYLGMIQAFRFEVEHMEGVCRLNQEKDPADMKSIITGLRECNDASSLEIADLMQANLNKIR